MYGEIFLEKTTEMEAKMRIDGSSLASNPKLQIISKLQFSNDLNDFVWEVGFLVSCIQQRSATHELKTSLGVW
jgi:hypothetical protein